MTGRETILAAIRQSLASSRPMLETMASRAPHTLPPFVHEPAADPVAQMVRELQRLEARAERVDDDAGALAMLRRVLVAAETPSVVAWPEAEIGLRGVDGLLDELGIDRLDASVPGAAREDLVQRLEGAAVGITGVDLAIAESGTLLLAGGTGRGRLASLLAPVHVAIVREAQIVRGLGEALARLRVRDGGRLLVDRSTLTCITGPSRTADIEFTLTLGVHGPREVHVIIVR